MLLGSEASEEASSGEAGTSDESHEGAQSRNKSQTTNLVALACQDDTEVFHDATGKPYITFSRDGHRETWPLKSEALRDWLGARFYAAYVTAPASQALQDALNTLAGIAKFEGECRPVAVRFTGHEGDIYLDLGNDAWEVVRVTAAGWEVIPAAGAPIRFRRPNGLLPLPHPTRGGNLRDLRRLVNVKDKADFMLIIAWLLGALRPNGPYTILCLTGEQGAAKTTLARMLRSLIDPNRVPLRAEPREEGDLLITATNGLIVGFDNLSHLSPWLSDALCRLATGGRLSRASATTLMPTECCSTRIERSPHRDRKTGPSRAVTPSTGPPSRVCVPIAGADRRTEAGHEADFAAVRPAMLGILLDAASTALRNWPTTKLDRLPRMADFAQWVEAGAPEFGWETGHFLAVYMGNRGEADEIALDALPVGVAVRTFMADRTAWEGTATELLTILTERAGEMAKERGWPKRAHVLSGQLKRLAPNFRRLGIDVQTSIKVPGGRGD